MDNALTPNNYGRYEYLDSVFLYLASQVLDRRIIVLYVVGGHTLEIEPRGTTTHQIFHLSIYYTLKNLSLDLEGIIKASDQQENLPSYLLNHSLDEFHHKNRQIIIIYLQIDDLKKKVSLNNHNVELSLW